MVAYYLKSAQPDAEKRDHYFHVIDQNVAKVEANLDRLRALTEEPGDPERTPPREGPVR